MEAMRGLVTAGMICAVPEGSERLKLNREVRPGGTALALFLARVIERAEDEHTVSIESLNRRQPGRASGGEQ